jgi:hypothetical protein
MIGGNCMKMNKRILLIFLLGVSFVFFAIVQSCNGKANANRAPPDGNTTKYTVTFDVGTETGEAPKTEQIESGGEITLHEPENVTPPTNMEFGGWYLDDNTRASSPYRITKNIKLTAKWEEPRSRLKIYEIENIEYKIENMEKDNKTINDNIKDMKDGNTIFAIVLLFVVIFSFFIIKKKYNELKQKNSDLDNRLSNVSKNQNTPSDSNRTSDNGDAFQKIEKRLDEFEKLYELQKKLNDELQRRLEKPESSYIHPARPLQTLSPVEAYNEWAAKPVSHLPAAFTYLEGDMRMREEQNLKPTANESMWITNKYGSQKYLFPNPNLFDQMTDLKDIYKMDLSKLKAKGQNRIKIIKACEMSDKGFISYGGELELL